MQHEDFDIPSLASYLHLNPQQVERLAERGKVPGRKVGGKWRFSPAEIHHWMEERMGLLDDDQLAKVEGALHPQVVESDEHAVTVVNWLRPDTIALPLVSRTRGSVINDMVRLAADSSILWDQERMTDAVRAREDLQSTALDNGVALLHPRRPLPDILAEPLLAIGVTRKGIPFGGGRSLTDIFFLICSRDERSHLRMLARISRIISSDAVLTRFREARDAAELYRVVCDAEAQLASDV